MKAAIFGEQDLRDIKTTSSGTVSEGHMLHFFVSNEHILYVLVSEEGMLYVCVKR